jgi:hypothetical protein
MLPEDGRKKPLLGEVRALAQCDYNPVGFGRKDDFSVITAILAVLQSGNAVVIRWNCSSQKQK